MPGNGHGLTPYQKTKHMKNRVCATRNTSPNRKAAAKSWPKMASTFLCQTWMMWLTSGTGSRMQASQTPAPWGQSPLTGQHCTPGSAASVCALSPGNCAPCAKPVAHLSAKCRWPEIRTNRHRGQKTSLAMTAPTCLKKSPPSWAVEKPKADSVLSATEFA